MVLLVGALNRDGEVLGLFLGENGKLNTELGKMGTGNSLVKLLGKEEDTDLKGDNCFREYTMRYVFGCKTNLVVLVVLPELDLSKDLVGERV